MSLEAMQFLAEAEEKVKQMKLSSAAAAKKRLANARLAGEAMLDEALRKARNELDALTALAFLSCSISLYYKNLFSDPCPDGIYSNDLFMPCLNP